ncbi:defense against restriction DarA-related protein [Robinsoniella peoriensis]|uniref:defense against restriction DarA-related protein n=1 Tax=Robinsoniella peoriensis TaxID=180332 RepID=UPI0036256A46
MRDYVKGYEIKRAIVFENDRGFALGENPQAVQPFATWQFTEGASGRRDNYWGHYTTSKAAATRDYENRVSEYQHDYGVSEKSAYRYYSTQRPVDIGTFPKTENGPLYLVNFDKRESVEQGRFLAWGYLVYDAPLTEKQMADYELRAAPGNPDRKAPMRESEESKSIAARLAEGAKQAAWDKAARSAPKKGTEKNR